MSNSQSQYEAYETYEPYGPTEPYGTQAYGGFDAPPAGPHTAETLVSAIREGAPGFSLATVDAEPGLYMVVRIFQAVLGVREKLASDLPRAYAALANRLLVPPSGSPLS